MPRYFAPITISELKSKIDKEFSEDGRFAHHVLMDKLKSDIKVDFDWENSGDDDDLVHGYHTMSNGLTWYGMYAGGDWEYPVTFIVYWDGKKLRGYVPKEGNPWNTDTKRAFGNDSETDAKNAKIKMA